MDIDQTQANVGPAVPRPPAPRGQGSASREEFAAVLGRMDTGTMKPEDRAQEGARQLVSTALVQPVLKALRESNRAAPPFAPSQGACTFRATEDTRNPHVTGERWDVGRSPHALSQ